MKINLKLNDSSDSPKTLSNGPEHEYYPDFTVVIKETEGGKDLDDIPESGEMTVKYRLSRTSEDKKTGRCTYTVEVMEIVSAKGAKETPAPSKSYDEAGAALDKLAAEKSKK